MKLLTKEQQESYENAKICYICKKKLKNKYLNDEKYGRVRDHCDYTGEYRGVIHSIYNLKYSAPKNIPIALHNMSNYDYHFIINKLAEEFEKQFTYLRENTEKSITVMIPIEKEVTRIAKNGEEITKHITCYNLLIAQNLWQIHYQILSIIFIEEFIKSNLITDTMTKNGKLVELHMNYATVFLSTPILKMI